MITKIHLENFKGIKERQTIELKPITLLFGPNSAGKSTIIQALHYMREILVRQNFNADRTLFGGETIDLGGFRNLVYNHDINLPIKIRIDLDLKRNDLPSYNPYTEVDFYFEESFDNEDGVSEMRQREERDIIDEIYFKAKSTYVEMILEWKENFNKVYVTEYETGFNDKRIASIKLNRIMASGEGFYELSEPKVMHSMFEKLDFKIGDESIKVTKLFYWFMNWLNWDVEKITEKNTFPLLKQKSAIPAWNKFLSLDKTKFRESDDSVDYLSTTWFIPEFFTTILTGPGEMLKNELEKFRYIGPIREILPRNFKPTISPNENRWASGLGAWDLLYKESENYLADVNKYLSRSEYLDSGYEIKAKEYKELRLDNPAVISLIQDRLLDEEENIGKQIRQSETSKELALFDLQNEIEVSMKDVGVGISQVIPVIVGAIAQTSSVLAIEQPELHLHPKMMVALSDVFINQINENPDVIYLLETHSEHLMLRFLRRIEDTTNNENIGEDVKLKPESISVNCFEKLKEKINITNIPIDETGEFTKQWPNDGFFEERAKELFR